MPSLEDIPVLGKENYMTWKSWMKSYLEETKLWDYALGEIPQPQDIFRQQYSDWLGKQAQVKIKIRQKCGQMMRQYIEALDGTESWKQLALMHEYTFHEPGMKMTREITNHTWCPPLYNAIADGNWKVVSKFLEQNEGALKARLTSNGELLLHVAVLKEKVRIVKELVKKMDATDLKIPEKQGRTVLQIAASIGNVHIVKAIVEKEKSLVTVKTSYNIPIVVAGMAGKREVMQFLYRFTIEQYQEEEEKMDVEYKKVLEMGKEFKKEKNKEADPEETDLREVLRNRYMMDVKEKPKELKRIRATILTSLIFREFYVLEFLNMPVKTRDVENGGNVEGGGTNGGGESSINNIPWWFCRGLYSRWCHDALISVGVKLSCIKKVYDMKLKHDGACKLLKELWRLYSSYENFEDVEDELVKAMFNATEFGIVEFIEEVIKNCPKLLSATYPGHHEQHAGQTIFHYAKSQRQVQIFRLFQGLGPMKDDIVQIADESEQNYMSHLAAKKATVSGLNRMRRAALQVRRDVQWYQAVESIMPPSFISSKNKNGQTSRKLFLEEHKQLVDEGAKWMKETAQQCIVVATLIATIMFQAVFSIPDVFNITSSGGRGGGEITSGTSSNQNYIHNDFSTCFFVVTNILGLTTSVASMLMFLAIITTSYAEKDFLRRLPLMLIMSFFSFPFQ
ncbi:uncharacterized protein LOC122074260 [Macadamia integrifolia]|uniref:uncharacterized protein LOC122074260 n=1 Tax=Macadamia integrifolia TaxID=60698 RepID=UPI001C4EDA6E|nr:uncharacterized protein LOC122074260 [Macadamia integrifolia]